MSPRDERRQRADQLFDAALDLTPEERTAFLDESCADDVELRQLVERLIAGAGDTEIMPGGGMEGPFWQDLVEELGLDKDDDEDLASGGTVIERYRVVREIGRGGMARVYLAERADGQFQQQVALKRIRSDIDIDEVLQRFDQERQILALAHHPNIAQLIDGGVDATGRPYFVMEYVEGEPIDRYCDAHQLSLRQRLELFLQVARALEYAHRNLVVHRDIKPSNILVTADGHVKLLDFGIAKMLDAEDVAGETPVTRSFTRLMTPVYASPEQVRGDAVTTASDTYQLGLLLFLLLTGRWPYHFTEQQPMAVVRAICDDEPTLPSIAVEEGSVVPAEAERPSAGEVAAARGTSAARLQRQLAGDLDNIVRCALRKEPERRYGAVAQLIDDIERYLTGRPVSARRDTFGYRAGKLIRRHRAAFSTAAAALVLLTVLAVFYTLQLARERDRARLAADEAGQVSAFLRGLFEVSAPTRSKGREITAQQLLDRGAEQIERELADQPPLQAEMMTLMGSIYRELAFFEEAEPLLEKALTLRREEPGTDRLALAESLQALAALRSDEGEHDLAQALYEEALEIREVALGADDPEVARTLSGLARVLQEQSAYEQSRRYWQRALDILESALGPDHPDVGHCLVGLGEVFKLTRRFEQAQEDFSRALEIFEGSYEEDHPAIADTRVALASLLRIAGDAAAARAEYERALPMLERVYGPQHPEVAMALDQLGRLLNAARERDAAIDAHERALTIREVSLGADHHLVAASLNNLGLTYWGKKDLASARDYFSRSAAVLEAAHGPDHVDVTKPVHSIAELLAEAGELSEAGRLFERVLEVREKALGPESSLLSRPLYNLGKLRMKQGRPGDAEPLLRRAIALGRDRGSQRQAEVIWPRVSLAECLTALGNFAEAEELFRLIQGDENANRFARRRAGRGLVELFEAWGRPLDAERERQALAALASE